VSGFRRIEHRDNGVSVAYYPTAYQNGRFRVLRQLAGAGQGYTLLVRDTWSDCPAVLKGIWWTESELRDPNQTMAAKQKSESLLADGLAAVRRASQRSQQVPAIVHAFRERPSPSQAAVGSLTGDRTADEEMFVVQQFVGVDLDTTRSLQDDIEERSRQSRPYSEEELISLAEQVCRPLAALHARYRPTDDSPQTYWVHCDVKPENILVLGPPAQYLLIDYDGAAEAGQPLRAFTPPYAPPPATAGQRDLPETDTAHERFDVYGFAATLYHTAALRPATDDLRRILYYGSDDERKSAVAEVGQVGYGPIISRIITDSLSQPRFRLNSIAVIQTELARARHANALAAALELAD